MKKAYVFSCIALIALLIINCNVFAKTKSEEAAIQACIENEFKALQDEDIDAFWALRKAATAQEREQTNALLNMAFENYDLSFKIESYKLLNVDSEKARVEVVAVTRKMNGPEFKDNRSKSQYFLKKIDGRWYIVKTENLSVEYLESDNLEQIRPNEINKSDEAAIRKCIEDNMKANQDEDFDAIWKTCKPALSSQEKKQLVALMKETFKVYDLSYEIESYKLIKLDNKTARVGVVQITKKVRGPEFQNIRTKNLHYLQKINGKWYIVNTEVLGYEYLD